jgi:chaperonin GroEL
MFSVTRSLFKNVLKHQAKSLSFKYGAFFAAKELTFGMDCRQRMLEGCDKLADAV